MNLTVLLLVVGCYLFLSLCLLPFQYQYVTQLKEMDKKRKEKGISQNEMYEKMSFENQQLHFNAQGSPLFMGANLLATLLYNYKHKKK